jgi:hypothetical protein
MAHRHGDRESVAVVRGEYIKASAAVLKKAAATDRSGTAKFLLAKYANQPDTLAEHPAAAQDPEQIAELLALAERLTQHFTPLDYEPVKTYS